MLILDVKTINNAFDLKIIMEYIQLIIIKIYSRKINATLVQQITITEESYGKNPDKNTKEY